MQDIMNNNKPLNIVTCCTNGKRFNLIQKSAEFFFFFIQRATLSSFSWICRQKNACFNIRSRRKMVLNNIMLVFSEICFKFYDCRDKIFYRIKIKELS